MSGFRINLTFQRMVKRLSVQEGKRGEKKEERNCPFLGLTSAFALIECVCAQVYSCIGICML